MRFGPWYPLAAARAHAPAEAGIFQIRLAQGLRDYPRGKSAMMHYQLAADLRAETTAFAARHVDAPWLCRHSIELSTAERDGLGERYARVLGEFVTRFGDAPAPGDPPERPPGARPR